MKYFFLIHFVVCSICFCQQKPKDDLYLYFKEDGKKFTFKSVDSKFQKSKATMIKVSIGSGMPITYSFKINNEGFAVGFDSYLCEGGKIKEFETKTISLEDFKKKDVKDFKWLKKQFIKHDYIDFNEIYENIFIVEMDSVFKNVYVTRVVQVESIE